MSVGLSFAIVRQDPLSRPAAMIREINTERLPIIMWLHDLYRFRAATVINIAYNYASQEWHVGQVMKNQEDLVMVLVAL